MRNHSYENKFHLQVHIHANQTHFPLNVNGFARRLVLKQRQRVTRKWPIKSVNELDKEWQGSFLKLSIQKLNDIRSKLPKFVWRLA